MGKTLTIVVPVYNESQIVPLLWDRLRPVIQSLPGVTTDCIFVNDGSHDASAEALAKLAAEYPQVKVINFARNFGKEVALTAGLDHADGDAVIFLDSDLQHPPELIPQMLVEWAKGADIVTMTHRRVEKHSLMRRGSSHLYYWIMSRISDLEFTAQNSDFRLIDRRVVRELRRMHERSRIFRGLIDWLGFKRVVVEFDAAQRPIGKSTYSYRKLLDLALTSFVSYSQTPLKFIALTGAAVTVGSGMLFAWMLAAFLLQSHTFIYTPLAIVLVFNTFMIGIVLSCLGIISLYIAKIYSEVIPRPLYIIDRKLNFGDVEPTKPLGPVAPASHAR